MKNLDTKTFRKNQIECISRSAAWTLHDLFLLYVYVEEYQNILKLYGADHFLLPQLKFFLKTKLISPSNLPDEIISHVVFYKLAKFHCLTASISRAISQFHKMRHHKPISKCREKNIHNGRIFQNIKDSWHTVPKVINYCIKKFIIPKKYKTNSFFKS